MCCILLLEKWNIDLKDERAVIDILDNIKITMIAVIMLI